MTSVDESATQGTTALRPAAPVFAGVATNLRWAMRQASLSAFNRLYRPIMHRNPALERVTDGAR